MPEIKNPILKLNYEDPGNNWYVPWVPECGFQDSDLYKQAVDEGWHEWIESEDDVKAVEAGYRYDQSYDIDGNPCYWIHGGWQFHDGTFRDPVEHFEREGQSEKEYILHCGAGDKFLRRAEIFLVHTKEPLTGKPYRFLFWSYKLFATLYGWIHRETGFRRYQHATVEIAKKNSKSSSLAIAAINGMLSGQSQHVYGCACDRNQARIIYDECVTTIDLSKKLAESVKFKVVESKAEIKHPSSASFYKVLSADAYRNDGIDSSITLVDEIHRHPSRKLYSVMLRAGRARPDRLMFVITTYGPSTTDGSIWAEVHNTAKQKMEGQLPNLWRNLVWIASAEPIPVTVMKDAKKGDTRIEVRRLQQPIAEGEVIQFKMLDENLASETSLDEIESDDESEVVWNDELGEWTKDPDQDPEYDSDEEEEGELSFDESRKVSVRLTAPARRFQRFIEVEPLTEDIPKLTEATANETWNNEHGVVRANPSAGVIFPVQDVLDDAEAAKSSPETEAECKQLSFNIASGSGRKWISAAAWESCKKTSQSFSRRYCWGGLDISFANDLTAFTLAFPSWSRERRWDQIPNNKRRVSLLTWAWVPDAEIAKREEFEDFPYREYAERNYFGGKGHIRIIEDSNVIDFDQVVRDIAEICENFEILGIAVDPNYGSFVTPGLEREHGIKCIEHRQGGVSMAPPTKRFGQLVYSGQLAPGDCPVLDRAINNAVLHTPDRAGNTYPSKDKSYARIDPAISAVMATGYCIDPPEAFDDAYGNAEKGMWGAGD